MSTIQKDGWTYDENWNFVCFLMRESKENDLKDVDNLKKALGRIASSMGTRFGRRFSFHSIRMKLEQMRIRHRFWKKFLNTPGVSYDIENCESTVKDAYWAAIDMEAEPELFKYFRKNGNTLCLMLECIFETEGVTMLPRDLTGSPQWPIHVPDDDDDDKALVAIATGSEFILPFLFPEECYVDIEEMFPEKNEGAIVEVNEVNDVQGRKLFHDDIEGGSTGETSGDKVD